jgi:sarcosine oxidase subunit beta
MHDVVIIGAGIAGISLAYFLAKAGQDVCVLEKSIVGGEGTGRCAGGVRQNMRPSAELSLSIRSIALWKGFAEEADLHFQYRQHGNLSIIWDQAALSRAAEIVNRQQAAGLECSLLDRDETQRLVPSLIGDYLGGVYSPSCGSAEPYLGCIALARLAVRHGARICEGRPAIGIQVTNGQVSAVHTPEGPIRTGSVVNAAGPWAPLISQMVNLRLPGTLCRSHILVTEPLPPLIEPFLGCGPHGYFRQTEAGNVLIGFGSLPVPDYSFREASYEALITSARRAATLFPRLRSAAIIRVFTGFTMWTPDEMPILGAVSEPQGFYTAAELNATGFAMGPVFAQLMAELILDGGPSHPIDPFSPGRFHETCSEGRLY